MLADAGGCGGGDGQDVVAEEVRQRLRTVAGSGSQARRTVEAINEVL